MQTTRYFYYGLLLLCGAIALSGLSACNCVKGSGQVISDTLFFSGLNKVDIDGDFKVFLRQDTATAGRLIIVAEDNIAALVLANRLTDSTLVLRLDNSDCIGRHEAIELYITMPTFNGLKTIGNESVVAQTDLSSNARIDFDIWGSGNVSLKEISAPIVDIDLNGASKMSAEKITANALTSKVNGSGNLEIQQGTVYSHNLSLLGTGNFYAFYLYATNYDIIVNAAGSAEVNCSGELKVFMNGTGNVYYRGNPQNIYVTGSGTGTVGGG